MTCFLFEQKLLLFGECKFCARSCECYMTIDLLNT